MNEESIRSESLLAAWEILAVDGAVRYFAKNEVQTLGGFLRSPGALARAARNLESIGLDVYLHLNPSKPDQSLKAQSSSVTALRHILIDLDPYDPTEVPRVALEHVLEIADGLFPGVAQAAHTIDSGRGAQGWIAVDAEHHGLRTAEAATSRFLHRLRREWNGRLGYRVDSVCSDLARIARCPGTRNTKTGRLAQLQRRSTHRIAGAELIRLFPPLPVEDFEIVRPAECSNLVAASPHLNNLAREFLHAGVEEGDRHHAAYVAARSLYRLGMDDPSVAHWVLRGARRCRPKLKPHEAIHCIETARKKEAELAV